MYKHWRFRPPEESERYPAYSNPTELLEKITAAAKDRERNAAAAGDDKP